MLPKRSTVPATLHSKAGRDNGNIVDPSKIKVELKDEEHPPDMKRSKTIMKNLKQIDFTEEELYNGEVFMTLPASAPSLMPSLKLAQGKTVFHHSKKRSLPSAMTPRGHQAKNKAAFNVLANPDAPPAFKTMLNAKRNSLTSLPKHRFSPAEEGQKDILENLEKNITIAENDVNAPERTMLLKYTFNWTELAIAYQQEGYFDESIDCIDSAAAIYDKLMMYPHLAVCLGLFLLATVRSGVSVGH